MSNMHLITPKFPVMANSLHAELKRRVNLYLEDHAIKATGNFNKVVQRIPVRISIDSTPHIELIKPGMSVKATVDLRT